MPTLSHGEVALQVLEAKKPLLLEKPATVSRAQFDTLEGWARAARVPTIVLFHYFRAAEVIAAARHLRSYGNENHVAWHSSTYDPYNSSLDLDNNFALVNTWIDSGINQLSVLLTLWPDAELRLVQAKLTPPNRSSMGTISATAAFELSGPVCGMAVFEVNWALGIDEKITRIDIANPHTFVELNHSLETLSVSAGTQKTQTFTYSTSHHRLTNHYVNLLPWAVEQISNKKSNWDFARRVHSPYFDVLERTNFA